MDTLYNPEYLEKLCRKYHLTPSKNYGQNFLVNQEPIEKMLEAAEVSPLDQAVEVGPGFGVLTLSLAERVQKIIAFEIEKKLQPYWHEQLKKFPNIEIIWGNILRQFQTQAEARKLLKYKVIANLPYQITSPVIRLFLEHTNQPERMVCMVQKEVGERICAKPGELSLLAIAVQVYGKPEYVTTIPRAYFWPSPQVDSAIIKITPHPSLLLSPLKLDYFFKLVKVGFANRRKVLFNNLLPVVNKNKLVLGQAFEQIGLDQKVRAQELSVAQWMRLAELVSSNG